jgi:Protein of unknown function (DUF3889)
MIRKTCIALGIIMTVNLAPTLFPTIANEQQEIPAYAKWGMIAIKEIHSKYPHANIIDYLYEGSESKEDTSIEKFKLWLKDDVNEFGVFVTIVFNTETEELITIELQETSS